MNDFICIHNIGRVSLTRSIPNKLKAHHKIRIELNIISEFFATRLEDIDIHKCHWDMYWENVDSFTTPSSYVLERTEVIPQSVSSSSSSSSPSSSSSLFLYIITPSREGYFHLHISCTYLPPSDEPLTVFETSQASNNHPYNYLILPLITDKILITCNNSNSNFEQLLPSSYPTLFCYRDISLHNLIYPMIKYHQEEVISSSSSSSSVAAVAVAVAAVAASSSSLLSSSLPRTIQQYDNTIIRIQEEYGAQIGSHIWDSSIILLKYLYTSSVLTNISSKLLQSLYFNTNDMNKIIAVELGAGLGLCGIYLAKYHYKIFKHVIISDTMKLLHHINTNIIINKCNDIAKTVCIDFSCVYDDHEYNLESYMKTLDDSNAHQKISLIIAADVLYDNKVAKSFLQTAKTLMVLERDIHNDHDDDDDDDDGCPCTFIIAQKTRGDKDRKYFESLIESISIPLGDSGSGSSSSSSSTAGDKQSSECYRFCCELLHSEACVYVWSLQLRIQ